MRGTIVCGVSNGVESRAAVQLAGALAARIGLRLVLVHIVTETQPRPFDAASPDLEPDQQAGSRRHGNAGGDRARALRRGRDPSPLREPSRRARPGGRRGGGGRDCVRLASARRARPAAALHTCPAARGSAERACTDRSAGDPQAERSAPGPRRSAHRPASNPMGFSRLPLLWRIFAINAGLLLAGTLVLVFSRGRIHASVAVVETVDLAVGLVVMLAANLLLLRRTLAPVDRLVERMRTVDLLRPGQRLAEEGGVEVVEVVRAFDGICSTGWRPSAARAAGACSQRRRRSGCGSPAACTTRSARSMTGVLLHARTALAADRFPPGRRAAVADEAPEGDHGSASEEVRRIAHELRPELLEHLGLVSRADRRWRRRFAEQSRPRRSSMGLRRRAATASNGGRPSLPSTASPRRASPTWPATRRRVAVDLAVVAAGPRQRRPPGQSTTGTARDPSRRRRAGGTGGLRGMRERAVLVGGRARRSSPARTGGVEIRLEVPAEGERSLMPVPRVTCPPHPRRRRPPDRPLRPEDRPRRTS